MLSSRYRAAAPADAYYYGVGWTDLFAGTTVDAIRGAGRQALTIRHFKTLNRTSVYAIPTARTFVPIH